MSEETARPFTARVRGAETSSRIQDSPSFRLAHEDVEFLRRDELRPVRLQLELLKPELLLQEHKVRSTVVVFGSARIVPPGESAPPSGLAVYYEQAREFARLISQAGQREGERDYVVMTGGGPGIMEAANRGAADAGAVSVGLNILLPREQAPNPYITPELCFHFHYFALRKMHFLLRARALAIFPGGFGTLDELFDALTLIQTGKIAPLPILMFGENYWREVLNFDAMVAAGTISTADRDLLHYVSDARAGFEYLLKWYQDMRPEVPPE